MATAYDTQTLARVGLAIVKVEDAADDTVVVYGKPTDDVIDQDRQIADPGWFRKALPEWFRWGNIREMHGRHAVGRATKLEWDADNDPWITAKIVDRDAVRKVREGVYQGFSIGVMHPEIRHDPHARGGRIVGGDIVEVSLVDRPSVPTAKLTILKRAGPDAWEDGQTGAWLDKFGNVRPPTASNSGDFDSFGNPVLQPGHVQDNRAAISVVTMDDRGVVLRYDQTDWLVPYTVSSDGMYHFGAPEPLPRDPKAEPDDPRETWQTVHPGDGPQQTKEVTGAMADAMRAPSNQEQDLTKRDWDPHVGAHGADRDTIPAEDFIDPERRRFPIVAPQDVEDAVHSYGRAKPPIPYEHFRRRLEAIARRKGEAFVARLPKEWRDDGKEEKMALPQEKIIPLQKAAEEAVKARAYCPQCRKAVRVEHELERRPGDGGHHVRYKAECGHTVHRFEAAQAEKAAHSEAPCEQCGKTVAVKTHSEDHQRCEGECGHVVKCFAAKRDAREPESPDATTKGVETGQGPEAGSVHGNARGERPGHTNPEEKIENNILGQLRDLLSRYEAVQREEAQTGRHEEGTENRLLAAIKEKVDALIANQGWAMVEGVDKAAQATLLKASLLLATKAPQLAKAAAARHDHKARLRAIVKRLSEHIEELPDDPLAEHPRGVAKAGGLPLGSHTNPKGSGDNTGGPAPDLSVQEQIREDVAALNQLVEEIAASERGWMPEGGAPGDLGPENRPVAPTTKAAPHWDLRGADRTPEGGRDAPRMGDAHDNTGLEKMAGALGAALEKTLTPIVERIETIAHMAAPPRPPVQLVEPATEFGNPYAQPVAAELTKSYVEQWRQLSPAQQDELARRLVAAARRSR